MRTRSIAAFLVLALLLILSVAPAGAALKYQGTPAPGHLATSGTSSLTTLLSGWAVWIWNPYGGMTGLAWKSALKYQGPK